MTTGKIIRKKTKVTYSLILPIFEMLNLKLILDLSTSEAVRFYLYKTGDHHGVIRFMNELSILHSFSYWRVKEKLLRLSICNTKKRKSITSFYGWQELETFLIAFLDIKKKNSVSFSTNQ